MGRALIHHLDGSCILDRKNSDPGLRDLHTGGG